MSLPGYQPFYNMTWVEKDGNLTPNAALYSDENSQTLVGAIDIINSLVESTLTSGAYTINGVVIPSKTTAQITALEPSATLGTMWFDTSIAKLKVKTASGVIETITSS